MDNKSELFDLKREKRELDAFLSKITEAEPSISLPPKEAAQTKDALSPSAESKSAPVALQQEPSGLKLEMPAVKDEGTFMPFANNEKAYTPSGNEFIPRFTDAVPFDLALQTDAAREKLSSFMSLGDEKKMEAPFRITIPQSVKPLESLKTMTRFDGTTKSGGRVAEMPLSEEKKISAEIEAEKKSDKTSSYDFAPEKKGIGKSKRIWILIILLILLVAGYFWFSSNLSTPGSGSFFKIDQSAPVSSVKEIKLQNIRQRLVYNLKLGKSIRVIEGIAENTASYPVSKIKVVANLFDANATLLASMESFAGNILIDPKLESLDEAGLVSALKREKTSEDKIPPKGQVPFMIIFTSEPAGVHKLSVLPVDFKKY